MKPLYGLLTFTIFLISLSLFADTGEGISPSGPLASKPGIWPYFTFSTANPLTNQPIQFLDKSFAYPPIVSRQWNMGDNSPLLSINTAYTYTQPGTYNVSLTIRNAAGKTAIYSQPITIGGNTAQGILLNIYDTKNEHIVKFVRYGAISNDFTPAEYIDNNIFPVPESGNVFITPPPNSSHLKTDFTDTLFFLDVDQHLIGHIEYEYEFKYQKEFNRNAIIILHNDVEMCNNYENENAPYFPYNSYNNQSPNYDSKWNYFSKGEYPVSMLIPPNNEFPPTYDKIPVLFVHGINGTYSFEEDAGANPKSSEHDDISYWYKTVKNFNHDFNSTFHAWEYYYPKNMDFNHLANCLKDGIDKLSESYNSSPVDLVTHSMGGLITLTYMKKFSDISSNRLNKVLFLAPPAHGSIGANNFYKTALGWASEPLLYDHDAPAVRDLSFGSMAMYDLWSPGLNLPSLQNSNTINQDYFVCLFTTNTSYVGNDIIEESRHHNDGIVSISSASLLDKGIGFAALHGNHNDAKWGKPNLNLNSDRLISNIVERYFSTPSNSDFINNLQNNSNLNTDIKAIVNYDKSVLKPSGANISNINTSNFYTLESDVNYQKGNIVLELPSSCSGINSFKVYYNPSNKSIKLYNSWYVMGFPNNYVNIGSFERNKYTANKNLFYFSGKRLSNFQFSEYWGCSIPFVDQTKHFISVYIHGNTDNTLYQSFYPKYCETQLLKFQAKSGLTNLLTNNLTDNKYNPLTNQIAPISIADQSFIYVDNQTSYAELIINVYDAQRSGLPLVFNIQKPDGSMLEVSDSSCQISYDTLYGLFSAKIHNPQYGKYLTWVFYNDTTANQFSFDLHAKLESHITPFVVPDSSILTGTSTKNIDVALPYINQFLFDSLVACATIYFPEGGDTVIPLTVYNNTVLEEIQFHNSYLLTQSGEYSIKFNIIGKYDGYWFERVLYDQFEGSELPILAFPDVIITPNHESEVVKLSKYLYNVTIPVDSLTFIYELVPPYANVCGINSEYITGEKKLILSRGSNDTCINTFIVKALSNGLDTISGILKVRSVLPDLILDSVFVSTEISPGHSIFLNSFISNKGNYYSLPVSLKYYVSTDPIFDSTDLCIKSSSLDILQANFEQELIDTLIPDIILQSGNYYLISVIDPENELVEINKTNNIAIKQITILPWVGLPKYSPICISSAAININKAFPKGGFYSGPGVSGDTLYPSNAGPGLHNIIYSYTDSLGFSNSITSSILIKALPDINLGNDTVLFQGSILILQAQNPGCSYLWSDSTINQTLMADTTGQYWVIVADSIGCSQSDTINVSFVNAGKELQGVVTYKNLISTSINNADVKLIDGNDIVDQTITDATGQYLFNYPPTGNYSIEATTSKPWGGVNAIDALLILKHFVGLDTLKGLNKRAADLDGTISINSIDALLAMKRFVGITTSFVVGNWVWDSDTINIQLGSSIINNIHGLCFGDVNGSYIPSAKIAPSLILSNQGSLMAENGIENTIQVISAHSYQLTSASLVLKYKPDDIEIISVNPGYFATNDQGCLFMSNIHNSEIRVGWYSLTPLIINQSETLFSIIVRVRREADPMFTISEESNLADAYSQIIPEAEISVPKLVYSGDGFNFNCCVPNPISQSAEISFTIPVDGTMKVYLYNAVGEWIDLIYDQSTIAGTHNFTFNASKYANGIYWIKADFKGISERWVKTGKVVVVK